MTFSIEHTTEYWESNNPVLALNQHGRESDSGRFKVGDGSTAWNQLLYASTKIVLEGGQADSIYNPSSYLEEGAADSVYPVLALIDQGAARHRII